MSSEPPVVLFGCVVFILRVYFCVFVALWQTMTSAVLSFCKCSVWWLAVKMLHLISLQCCRVLVSVVVVLLCGLWFSFWWRIFHEACRHESQVFHKNIAREHAEAVLSGQTDRRNPPPVDLCCSCRFRVFWMSGQITISVLVSSLLPQVSQPEHVGTLGREPDPLESHWGLESVEKVPHRLTFLCSVWTQALGKYQRVEKETDMLLSTLSAMQDKAQHLECNLSAETRIKLDLFSVLGDTRRQLEIAQGSSVSLFCSVPSRFSQVQNSCAVWLILKVLTAEIVLQVFFLFCYRNTSTNFLKV